MKISQNWQENTSARVSFIIKLQACNFIKKETLAQVFSREFCEISKDSFFTEYLRWLLQQEHLFTGRLWTTASAHSVNFIQVSAWIRMMATFLEIMLYKTDILIFMTQIKNVDLKNQHLFTWICLIFKLRCELVKG